MKKLIYVFVAALIFISAGKTANGQTNNADNALTAKEVKDGWKLLWDGKTNAGWRGYNTPSFPATGWDMKDGMLTVLPPSDKYKPGGDIITIDTYKNFELSVDFLYTPGANSGIKYFIDGKTNVGCEYQVLDDKLHPDAKQIGRAHV